MIAGCTCFASFPFDRKRDRSRWSKLAVGLVSFAASIGTVLSQGTINFPPGGAMTQPSNHALIRSIGPTTLRAAMSDPDGSIASVRFFSGTNLLGTGIPSGLSEFVMTWTPGRTGNFSLSAEAVDNSGATGKTATVWISVATNPPAFAVIELETSPTNVSFDPLAINNQGVIVGSITNAAARWHNWHSETFDVFGKPAVARAVSDQGTIVGEFIQAQGQAGTICQPFCYTPDQGVRQLPGLTDGIASGVSQAGIVGIAATNGFRTTSFGFWYSGGNYAFFGDGGSSCQARDINDEGVIVGSLQTPAGETRPFIYRAGELTLLAGGTGSGANAVNRQGEVVGTAGGQAFRYESGTVTNMGAFGIYQEALDVNDHGNAVGYYYYADTFNPPAAFLFHDGVLIDLNELIPTNSAWSLRIANSINNGDWIVGRGNRAGDGFFPWTGSRGFLLVPGPMIRVLRATATTLEGRAYFANGPAVFERSTDLIHWAPVSTNATGAAEASFSLTLDPTNGAAFYRVVQPSAP